MTDVTQNSIELTDETYHKILEFIDQTKGLLNPSLISLSRNHNLMKLGKHKYFVEQAIRYTKSNPEFISSYTDSIKMEANMKTVDKLETIHLMLANLIVQLDDSIASLGSEAYSAALNYYHSVKRGSLHNNATGAKFIYEQLRQHFIKSSSAVNAQKNQV